MWKKCQIIMLPAKDKLEGVLCTIGRTLTYQKGLVTNGGYIQAQHLYILSDDEIKEGDWFFDITKNTIHKCHSVSNNIQSSLNGGGYHGKFECKKIIATTNKSISRNSDIEMSVKDALNTLPEIPQSFIEQFITSYNEGKTISDVMVEYDTIQVPYITGDGFEIVLKVNSNNTINIKTIKDSWSRDEVIELLHQFRKDFESYSNTKFAKKHKHSTALEAEKKWIEQNL